MVYTWLLLLLVIDMHGHKTQQTISFDSKEECYSAIVEYDQALQHAKWDTQTHGAPIVMCMKAIGV